MGIAVGKEAAELILVHQPDDELHSHSRNSARIDFVGADDALRSG
jgi:hypothetical protein